MSEGDGIGIGCIIGAAFWTGVILMGLLWWLT